MLNMAVRQNTDPCSQISVVWYILLSISFTSRELMATVCSDAIPKHNIDSVLRMCESGNAVGKQIVVDTFDSALFGVGNCNCDINFMTNMTTTVNLNSRIVNDLLPGAPCNSGVTLLYGNTFSTLYSCDNRKNFSEQLERNLSYRISWNHNTNTSKSGYCMQFESNSTDVSLNIACIKTDRPLTSSSSSTATSTSSTETIATTVPYIETPTYTIIVPTVIAGLAILITAAVFIAIWKRRSQTKSNGTKTAIGRKTSAFNVIYENTKRENEVDALKNVSYGSHYMHVHVYSNTVNNEYSMLESAQSAKNPDQTEIADKDAYCEISINKAEYYNQK